MDRQGITGGIPDKLGNRFEAKWLVRQLLDVIAGEADWLKFEGISEKYKGFEFAISRDGVVEWHQTKINSPHGSWTLNALDKEGFLLAIKTCLSTTTTDKCIFISQDKAKVLQKLSEKARMSSNDQEYTSSALSKELSSEFVKLKDEYWKCSAAEAFDWLQRIEMRTLPEEEIDGLIDSYSQLSLNAGEGSAFPVLRDFLEENFNKKITTDLIREFIRSNDTLDLKDWSLDPTITGRLIEETTEYLSSYSPFGAGGHIIQRSQVDTVLEALTDKNSRASIVLLTGVAGSGKSGIVRGVIERLSEKSVPHLALRVDQKLHCNTPKELGKEITDRDESPVTTLKGICPEEISVLVVDQVDAISEVSGRDGAVKNAILKMLTEAHNFKTVRLLFVCRTFDLENDARFKQLKDARQSLQIDVPLLDWQNEVEPILQKRGIDVALATIEQKALLCLPVNLAVFLELDKTTFSFKTRSDLFKYLIEKKQRAIHKNRNISWSAIQPLAKLASWMSDHQRLDAPEAVLDDFQSATDILATEGLIVRSRNNLSFFHESFFDYIFARAFTTGEQSLLELLTSTEQHLFRRTQTRQILEALRQVDVTRYIQELRDVLNSNDIRYHIKIAVSQWLGSQEHPNLQEFKILNELDTDADKFSPIVRSALLSSPGWFDLLLNEGWIEATLNGKYNRREKVLWWLAEIAGHRPADVAVTMRKWWNGNDERANRLVDWFGIVRRSKPDDELLKLCQDIIISKPSNLFREIGHDKIMMLLTTWSEKSPEKTGDLLKTLFDAWFDLHPGKNPLERDEFKDIDNYSLKEIAKKSPAAFLHGTTNALNRSIGMVLSEGQDRANSFHFTYRTFSGHRSGFDEFLHRYRTALCHLASSDPTSAQKYLQKLDASSHQSLLHLHLETISANPEYFARQIVGLLSCPEIFDAGWHGADWQSFANAAKASLPYLEQQEKNRIEGAIYAHRPEIRWAQKIAHKMQSDEYNESYYNPKGAIRSLNGSGYEQFCILETIGADLLSAKGKKQLALLKRKFPKCNIPLPHDNEAHWVGPPISNDDANKMSDKQWIGAIERYNSEEERPRRSGILVGGAGELGSLLQAETKNNPTRFEKLLRYLPTGTHPTYIKHILQGLAEAELDTPEILLKSAILFAHDMQGKPFGAEIADLFERHPLAANDPELFDILCWYAEHGFVRDEIQINRSIVEEEVMTVNDLLNHGESIFVRSYQGARVSAMNALGKVLWQVQERIPEIWISLERRIRLEQNIAVRCKMVSPLTPLFNDDKKKCANLLHQLVRGPENRSPANSTLDIDYLSPLITHDGINLLPYLFYHLPQDTKPLIDLLINSGNETMKMIGAWYIIRKSFFRDEYVAEADIHIESGAEYRRLAANLSAGAIRGEAFHDRVTMLLIRFFDDDDKRVRSQATDVFRFIKAKEFVRFKGLAKAYLNSKAYEGTSYSFFKLLEEAPCDVLDLVLEATEKAIANIEMHGDAGGQHISDLHHIEDLLKREYASSENDQTARKRILDIIDLTLEREIYGAENIVKVHER